MQNLSYWKQFENTGKVEDYLNYCNMPVEVGDLQDLSGKQDGPEQSGADPYAGIYKCNRNCIKTDAYRGI